MHDTTTHTLNIFPNTQQSTMPQTQTPAAIDKAAKKVTITIPLPEPTEETQTRWQTYIAGLPPNEALYTKKWTQTVKRMLGFTDIAPQERLKAFIEARNTNAWKWSTAAAYYGAIATGLKLTGKSLTSQDQMNIKWLEARSAEELTNHPSPMTTAHFKTLLTWIAQQPQPEMVAIAFSFLTGQRISDVLKLNAQDVNVRIPHHVCFTFRRGKVVPRIGPFTIQLSGTCDLAQRLLTRARNLPVNSRLFGDESLTTKRCRTILSMLGEELELRSVRRGGLQLMALKGVPLDTIRTVFSKHKSTEMLRTYLEHGATSLHEGMESVKITEGLMQDMIEATH